MRFVVLALLAIAAPSPGLARAQSEPTFCQDADDEPLWWPELDDQIARVRSELRVCVEARSVVLDTIEPGARVLTERWDAVRRRVGLLLEPGGPRGVVHVADVDGHRVVCDDAARGRDSRARPLASLRAPAALAVRSSWRHARATRS